MPALFPGMDPFIEGQEWDDFHPTFIGIIREMLTAQLRPRYVVRVERRVYVEHEAGEDLAGEHLTFVRPDVSLLKGSQTEAATANHGGGVAVAPVVVSLPQPSSDERREAFLTVRETETRAVVTVLEVLSPGNKRRGSDGRREYLKKRETVLQSNAHLVELDLLRGGLRLPTVERLPRGDYYAFVCRQERRWNADVYAWTLREPLPTIPLPLAAGDADGSLNLQTAFSTAYDRAGYDYSLDYQAQLAPRLKDGDAEWVEKVVRSAHDGRDRESAGAG